MAKESSIFIYAKRQSPRLLYVAGWLSEAWQVNVQVVNEMPDDGASVLCYGVQKSGCYSISDAGLLWETGLRQIHPGTGSWEELLTVFPGEGDVPFDLFSAIFYLLSRYEEYLPFTPDQHGRYPATESILFKASILRKPIVDLWLEKLGQVLKLPGTTFQRRLSYDIDRAFHIRNWPLSKGWGLWAKALLKGNYSKAIDIRKIAAGRINDPLDAFDVLEQLHLGSAAQGSDPRPIFFILAAQKRSSYDVNLSPEIPAMRQLIKRLATIGSIGLHPSYRSSDQPELISVEKNILEKITGKTIFFSRQHFMRLRLPHSYSNLIKAGITDDFSMGYGSHLGFRAGTGRSFSWYNLKEEIVQPLRIHPFCFMDTTAHFYEKLDTASAFSALKEMEAELKKCGSMLTTIFHNYSLGSDEAWLGWQEAYEEWVG